MTLAEIQSIFFENYLAGFALGLLIWFITWGLNRIYLQFKQFFNF